MTAGSGKSRVGGWAPDELIPFGDYILLDCIATDTIAATYRARRRHALGSERLAALRRILPHLAGDQAFVESFVREASIVADLDHPNICPVYELGQADAGLYVTMEYVAGKDLAHILTTLNHLGRPFPPMVACWIAAEVCAALEHAHTLRDSQDRPIPLLHRDLTTASILLGYDGQVRVMGFGVADAVARAHQTNIDALKQKLSYMSPEMVSGGTVGPPADLFSTAIILHEMLTGTRLFEGVDGMETVQLVQASSLTGLDKLAGAIPEPVVEVLRKALQQAPEARYESAGEMRAALLAVLAEQAPSLGSKDTRALMEDLYGEERDADVERLGALLSASHDPSIIGRKVSARVSPSQPPPIAAADVTTDSETRARSSATAPISSGASDEAASGAFRAPASEQAAESFGLHGLLDLTAENGGDDEEPTRIFAEHDKDLRELLALAEQHYQEPEPALPASSRSSPPAPPRTQGATESRPPRPAPVGLEHLELTQTEHTNTALMMQMMRSQRRERVANVLLLAGVFLLSLAVVGLLLRTPLGERLGLRPPTLGTIEIRTIPPADAAVKVDDVYRGVTPLRLEQVSVGSHEIVVEADGYETIESEVVTQPGITTVFEVQLENSSM